MYRLSDKLFTCSRLALNHYREIAWRDLLDERVSCLI